MWNFLKPILTHIWQDMRAIALKPPSIVRLIPSPAKKHPHRPRAKARETEESYPVNLKSTNPPKTFDFFNRR
jgi:hypothetical protein